MDLLYISPEFPPNYFHFIENLHSLGINVWGMGEADFYQMPENLQSALTWYIRTDLNNADAVQHAYTGELLDDTVKCDHRLWCRLLRQRVHGGQPARCFGVAELPRM